MNDRAGSRPIRKFSLVLATTALAALTNAPSPWSAGRRAIDASALGVRNAHSMIFDELQNKVLLFGGADASKVRGDTWEWLSDAGSWRLVTADGPGPRTFPAFGYDAAREEGILFGGNRVLFGKADETDTFLGDTWRLRRGRWQRVTVAGPMPRAEAAMGYDRNRRRLVLFGGHRMLAGRRERFADTWEWDGQRWIEVATAGPSARNGAALAYDERRDRIVLFGGPGPSNETWEWDGRRWSQQPSGDVPGRFNASMIYDAAHGVIVRFGGWTGKTRSDETWTRADGPWMLAPAQGPPARNHAAFVYDRARQRGVLFGGHDGDNVFGDTWEWTGNSWIRCAFTPPKRRIENGH
jgi:hypothetical protein